MANCFQFQIITAEGTLLDEKAEYCNVPTGSGSVGILANHAPMLCALREGTVRCRTAGGTEKCVKISDGVADVRDNSVTILADRAEVR
ncbi:MAG: ATP synthase F1 subunit epsilon [Oscillospiraceae bacterium]|nr:ATP synthase F1 subunit epsilon [Oscillospiraceae bacterium]